MADMCPACGHNRRTIWIHEKSKPPLPPQHCLVFSRHPPLPTHLPDLIVFTWSTSLYVCVCVPKRGHHKVATTPHQEASIVLRGWPASQLISNVHTNARIRSLTAELTFRSVNVKWWPWFCWSRGYLSGVGSYCYARASKYLMDRLMTRLYKILIL